MRYGSGITIIDRKIRKIVTITGELHPKINVAKVCVSRKRDSRDLMNCKQCVRIKENIQWYVKNKTGEEGRRQELSTQNRLTQEILRTGKEGQAIKNGMKNDYIGIVLDKKKE